VLILLMKHILFAIDDNKLLEMEYQLEKLGDDGDGGRVNVASGVDVKNNKSRIRLSGIKLTDEDVGVLSRRAL
nr:DNA/RNA helicase, ATP-dependent, DEAH-box type, conserved site-containing protein [Tanacetum cinerariifolium]